MPCPFFIIEIPYLITEDFVIYQTKTLNTLDKISSKIHFALDLFHFRHMVKIFQKYTNICHKIFHYVFVNISVKDIPINEIEK